MHSTAGQNGWLERATDDVRIWHKADIPTRSTDVRFSNRPFGVKHFQTIRRCSVDVTHGLVLLFGIGTRALVWGFFSQEV